MSNVTTTETVFTVEVQGEGTNIAGFPRHICMSKDFTRSQLETYLIADGMAEAEVKALTDSEMDENLSHGIAELEWEITGDPDELLAYAEWDVQIKA